MKFVYGCVLVGLIVCLSGFASAQCSQLTLNSFIISPGTISGDQSQLAVGTVQACVPPGVNQLSVYIQPSYFSSNRMICDGGGLSSNTCNYTGVGSGNVTVSFELNAYNYSGSDENGLVTVSVFTPTQLTQPLTVTSAGSPYEQPSQDPDGPCDCSSPNGANPSAGNPINVTNGDTWISQQDYLMPGIGGGLTLTRTWNSLWTNMQPPEQAGIFGDSWRSNFEERIQVLTGGVVKYWKGNGSALFYSFNSLLGTYSLTAPANDQTALSYSPTTTLWTVTRKDGARKIFNNAGYLTSIVDLNGNTISINVDAGHQNRIASITDASGHVLTFNYADASNPRLCTSVSDSVGTFTQYVYDDATQRLTRVQYPDGSQYNFHYTDLNGNTLISLVTDSQGKTVEAHTYDSLRRGLTSQQANDSNGSPVNLVTVKYAWQVPWQNQICDSTGNDCVTVQISNRAQRHFIALGSGSAGATACNSCGFSANFSTTLDAAGHARTSTDGNGNTALYAFDTQGNMLSKSLPDYFAGGYDVWSYTYNSFGEVLSATDPLNHATTNAYDSHGNLLSVTAPSPDGTTPASVTYFTPNLQGQITQIKDPLNNLTNITYCTTNQTNCPYGLIYYVRDAQNNKTTYKYDGRGNRLSITDATNKITQFQYDAMNRVTLITYATSPATTVQFHYDWRGRRDYVIDQDANKTSYGYDDADRLITVTDAQAPAAGVTTYGYDTEDNLTDIWDAKNNHTQFVYFPGKQLYKTIFPSGEYETYGWDPDNNLEFKRDRNGNTINYSYDYQNHVNRKTYPDGNAVNYTYDPAARLTEVQDSATGTYTFAYDNMNRLTQAGADYSFDSAGNLTVGYGYDAASNRTSMTDPQSLATAYTYDALNRLSTLAFNGQSPAFGFGYDALSRRTSLTRPNAVNTTYAYDPISRLTSILHKLGTTTLDGATYTYDNAGNRKTRTDKRLNTTLTYSYDNIYQLLSAKQGATTKETYTYDPVGNRLSSLGVSPYSYNSSNELTALPSGSYTYDNNGNTLTDATGRHFTWDFENRLTQVVMPGTGGTVNFKYDPFGRRIQKAFTQNGTTTTTNYVYDGDNLLEELDNSGNPLGRYTQQVLGVDQPLGELRAGTTSYYEADGLGSITSLSNTSGALANTYSYDSYGKVISFTGSLINPFQYTGREFDSETGNYFYRARYYDQTIGRFFSEDPIQFDVGINFYRYVKNNPLLYFDPFGRTCSCTYYQTTGRMICVNDLTGDIVVNATGYSGSGIGLNNPFLESVPNVGPLPGGFYNIAPGTTNRKGPITIALTPWSTTDMYDRNGMLTHGDNQQQNHSGSTGCIVLGPNDRRPIADCGGGSLSVQP